MLGGENADLPQQIDVVPVIVAALDARVVVGAAERRAALEQSRQQDLNGGLVAQNSLPLLETSSSGSG